MSKLAAIVDAYSTGRFLSVEFEKYGYKTVHVQSVDPILEFDRGSFRPENFVVNIISETVEQTASELESLGVEFVVAGCESGVLLADQLINRLGLQGNAIEKSKHRRNKYLMQSALKSAGVEYIESLETGSVDVAIKWFESRECSAVVVKPLDSAGSDGVFFCTTAFEISSAFRCLLNKVNSMGSMNLSLIIQEKLSGVQYIVNMVSCEGEHFVSDIWQEHRVEDPCYGYLGDREYLLDFRGGSGEVQELVSYARECLDALGVIHGPSHIEIMWCSKRNTPVLIELGARMQGSICHNAVLKAVGHSHVTLTALVYCSSKKFKHQMHCFSGNKFKCLAVLMRCPRNLRVVDDYYVGAVRLLPTYVDELHLPVKGAELTKTISMETCPGIVYFVGESAGALERDYKHFKILERAMYEANL